MIIIIFGLAASGKSHVGNTLAKHFGFHHEDADKWLSLSMQEYIIEKKLFTFEMLEDFTNIIIKNTELLKNKHNNIVITQALYRKKNREFIKASFKNENLIFIQIDSNDNIIYQRLIDRGDWVSPEYATSMHQFFEPMDNAYIITNNQAGEEHLIAQLNHILDISNS